MALGGALFAVVGTQAILDPNHAGHAIAGVLFAVVGLAAVAGEGALVFRWRSHLVAKLSGRKPSKRSVGSGSSGGYFGSGYFGDGGSS